MIKRMEGNIKLTGAEVEVCAADIAKCEILIITVHYYLKHLSYDTLPC